MSLSSGDPQPIISNVALGPSALGQHWKLLASAHHLIKPHCIVMVDQVSQAALEEMGGYHFFKQAVIPGSVTIVGVDMTSSIVTERNGWITLSIVSNRLPSSRLVR